ncbi:hypothetical protein RB195_007627 [Necator americanus]|uniref:Protein Wnt n=1 Tax=Necator americanus TaxID=51031 RepID=A0ABR1BY54_NECAM
MAHQRRLADQKAWSEKFSTTAGFEPAIFCSVGRLVIHCATRPAVDGYRGTPTVISRRKGEERKVLDHGRIRTCNLLLRRQTRYPLRHAAQCKNIEYACLTSTCHGTPAEIGRPKGVERKVLDHGRIRTCNLLLRRQTRYPLRHAAQCKNIEYACLTSTCHGTPAVIGRRKGEERKVLDHGRIRTCNLLLRRQTRYPLRHAAQCKNIEYACLTSTCHGTPAEIGRPKGVERKVLDHGRIRTCNLLLRRQTRYPLRHAAYCGWISWHSNGD